MLSFPTLPVVVSNSRLTVESKVFRIVDTRNPRNFQIGPRKELCCRPSRYLSGLAIAGRDGDTDRPIRPPRQFPNPLSRADGELDTKPVSGVQVYERPMILCPQFSLHDYDIDTPTEEWMYRLLGHPNLRQCTEGALGNELDHVLDPFGEEHRSRAQDLFRQLYGDPDLDPTFLDRQGRHQI